MIASASNCLLPSCNVTRPGLSGQGQQSTYPEEESSLPQTGHRSTPSSSWVKTEGSENSVSSLSLENRDKAPRYGERHVPQSLAAISNQAQQTADLLGFPPEPAFKPSAHFVSLIEKMLKSGEDVVSTRRCDSLSMGKTAELEVLVAIEGKRGAPGNRAPARERSQGSKSRRRTRRPVAPPFFEKEDRVQTYSPLDRQIVRFTKIVEGSNLVTSTTTPTFRSYVFTAADIADFGDLSAVFDMYRLDRVDMRLVPNVTETLASTPMAGKVYSCIDYDDSNAFTSLSEPVQYSNCMLWEPTDPIQVTLVPHLAMAAYSGVFTSFANSRPRWIDAASPGVQHYGVKLAFSSTTSAVTYTVQLRYHLSMKLTH